MHSNNIQHIASHKFGLIAQHSLQDYGSSGPWILSRLVPALNIYKLISWRHVHDCIIGLSRIMCHIFRAFPSCPLHGGDEEVLTGVAVWHWLTLLLMLSSECKRTSFSEPVPYVFGNQRLLEKQFGFALTKHLNSRHVTTLYNRRFTLPIVCEQS